jgi:hypothetical protein
MQPEHFARLHMVDAGFIAPLRIRAPKELCGNELAPNAEYGGAEAAAPDETAAEDCEPPPIEAVEAMEFLLGEGAAFGEWRGR